MEYGPGTNFFGFDDVTLILIFDHNEIDTVHKLICFSFLSFSFCRYILTSEEAMRWDSGITSAEGG